MTELNITLLIGNINRLWDFFAIYIRHDYFDYFIVCNCYQNCPSVNESASSGRMCAYGHDILFLVRPKSRGIYTGDIQVLWPT